MDRIVNIQNIDPTTLELQTYSSEDQNLIASFELENVFTSSTDYIEYTVYDLNKNLLLYIDNLTNYSVLNNKVEISPEQDLVNYGFDEGQYISNYNFFRNILGSSNDNKYYISEISSDRTEVRLDTTIIDNLLVISSSLDFTNQLQASNYYKDFYLNFGDNQFIIANNILLDTSDATNPTVLIKLYEPLPNTFDLKSELWVIEQVTDSLAYQTEIILIFDNLDNNIQLRGPNLNIPIKDRINNSTEYTNYNTLTNTTSQYGSSSLRYQLNSLLAETGFEINIDYTDYNNFIFFSSAQTRLENFYYKLSLIEEYTNNASLATGPSSGSYYVSSSYNIWQAKIDELITNFDGYEYFLYFESGSKCWPKTNSTQPYINAQTSDLVAQNWLTEQYTSASDFDTNLNPNNLINTIPEYLRDDTNNSQYELFVEMVGQHFDSIWVYIKDITNKYNADNRLDHGVSKDLIADILRDLGVKIYQNNFSTDDLYTSFLGITPDGNLNPSTGSELITTYITSSNLPIADVNSSIYKRIYHNLPYLFKKKGTVEGLRALITLYGIPDTILRINEFGGKNKDNSNDWDQWQNQYNYAFNTEGTNYVTTDLTLNSLWSASNNIPNAIEFRFNAGSTPTTGTQTLLSFDPLSVLTLSYSGSLSASYSGSSENLYSQYATLTYYPDFSETTLTASVYLPFFNGGWWSVLLNNDNNNITLIAKNSLYNGNDGTQIGFQSSSSLVDTLGNPIPTIAYFGYDYNSTYNNFNGLLQEVRYYSLPLSQSTFDDFVMNPYSIESSETLAFRAPLGGELYTGSVSIHPKVTGSWSSTSSFVSNSDYTFLSPAIYSSNTETIFLDQFPAGIRNIVNHKIKIADTILPTGDTLSPYIRTQQNLPISGSYTKDLNLLEVALSPQNEINEDIINQLGYFNLGEYIGDPRQLISTNTSYPDLNTLRDEYFSKYTHNYNLTDYIRLIKYFDNSLFKMIKDFVPARTSLASGIVIKQHLLERNRYRVPSSSYSEPYYTASVKSFPFDFNSSQLYKTSGGNAGVFDKITSDTYVYSSSIYYSSSYSSLVPSLTLSESQLSLVTLPSPGNFTVTASVTSSDYFNIYDGQTTSAPLLFSSGDPLYNINQEFNVLSGYMLLENEGVVGPSTVELSNFSIQQLNEYSTFFTSSGFQAWPETITTPLGPVNSIHSDQSEFLTGELSGSTIIASTQSLGPIPVPFELEVLKIDNGAGLITYYDIQFDFKSDKLYYIQLNINNADTFFNGNVYAYWLGSSVGTAGAILYENSSIPPSTVISPIIKIEYATTRTLRIINASLLNNSTSISATIYEVFNDQANPLLNNVSTYPPSQYFMDVDYSSGQLIPTNQGVLITGSATKAQVQDYNWNLRRSILPRYSGSKLTGAKINVHTNGDISYGKEPVINSYQTSFLTFKEIRNAYPELVGKSTLWINSLVDKDGNQLAVSSDTSSIYYYNLIDNFGKDSSVNLQITTLPTGSTQLDLDQSTTVYRPAMLWPDVILTNETGSNQDSNGNISFSTSTIDMSIVDKSSNIASSYEILSSSLWSVGANTSVITSSTQFYNIYLQQILLQNTTLFQQNNTFSTSGGGVGGYSPIKLSLLDIKKNITEIRFNQDENKVYVIKDITLNGPSSLVYFSLDRSIPLSDVSSINNGYLFRNNNVDPTKLVINAPKLIGGAPGYLTPQYMSPELVTSLDKTVETLKENGIL